MFLITIFKRKLRLDKVSLIKVTRFVAVVLVFQTGFLCSPDCPGACSVDQAGLKLNLPASEVLVTWLTKRYRTGGQAGTYSSILNDMLFCLKIRKSRFSGTYTKTGTIQRLAQPLSKDDLQIWKSFHILLLSKTRFLWVALAVLDFCRPG